MSEVIPIIDIEGKSAVEITGAVAVQAGKISVLEALATPAPENLTPSMSWQSAWSNKEDK